MTLIISQHTYLLSTGEMIPWNDINPEFIDYIGASLSSIIDLIKENPSQKATIENVGLAEINKNYNVVVTPTILDGKEIMYIQFPESVKFDREQNLYYEEDDIEDVCRISVDRVSTQLETENKIKHVFITRSEYEKYYVTTSSNFSDTPCHTYEQFFDTGEIILFPREITKKYAIKKTSISNKRILVDYNNRLYFDQDTMKKLYDEQEKMKISKKPIKIYKNLYEKYTTHMFCLDLIKTSRERDFFKEEYIEPVLDLLQKKNNHRITDIIKKNINHISMKFKNQLKHIDFTNVPLEKIEEKKRRILNHIVESIKLERKTEDVELQINKLIKISSEIFNDIKYIKNFTNNYTNNYESNREIDKLTKKVDILESQADKVKNNKIKDITTTRVYKLLTEFYNDTGMMNENEQKKLHYMNLEAKKTLQLINLLLQLSLLKERFNKLYALYACICEKTIKEPITISFWTRMTEEEINSPESISCKDTTCKDITTNSAGIKLKKIHLRDLDIDFVKKINLELKKNRDDLFFYKTKETVENRIDITSTSSNSETSPKFYFHLFLKNRTERKELIEHNFEKLKDIFLKEYKSFIKMNKNHFNIVLSRKAIQLYDSSTTYERINGRYNIGTKCIPKFVGEKRLSFQTYQGHEIDEMIINSNFKGYIAVEIVSMIIKMANICDKIDLENRIDKEKHKNNVTSFVRYYQFKRIEKLFGVSVKESERNHFITFPSNMEINNGILRTRKYFYEVPDTFECEKLVLENNNQSYYVISDNVFFKVEKMRSLCNKSNLDSIFFQYYKKLDRSDKTYIVYKETNEKEVFQIEIKGKICLLDSKKNLLYFDQKTLATAHEEQQQMEEILQPIKLYHKIYKNYPTHKLCSHISNTSNKESYINKGIGKIVAVNLIIKLLFLFKLFGF